MDQSTVDAIYDTIYFGYPLKKKPISWKIENLEDASLELLNKAFLEAASSNIKPNTKVILPLSGGLDSRLVLGTLLELIPSENIYAYTYGLPGQLDFEIPAIVAKETGVHHTQIDLSKITIDPESLLARPETIFETNAHNILGFHITQTATQAALQEIDLPSNTVICSGFLGDRLFAGKWSSKKQNLESEITSYVNAFKSKVKSELLPDTYDPQARLLGIYSNRPVSIEEIDLEQRQNRVRDTLKTTHNPYFFLFEDRGVMRTLASFNDKARLHSKLQRRYFHRYHPSLAKLPVTSRFGFPLRQSQNHEKFDRYIRLGLEKLDRKFGTSMAPFKRTKTTTKLLGNNLQGYEACIQTGMRLAAEQLSYFGITLTSEITASIYNSRALAEQISSLGYLTSTMPLYKGESRIIGD